MQSLHQRAVWVKERLEKETIYPQNCVFLDESGFDINMTRGRARSAVGEPAVVETPSGRAVSDTVLGAISSAGVICKDIHIVMDNAHIHVPALIDPLIEKRGYVPVYLPPYSPELNPIEDFWTIVKSKVKRYALKDTETLIIYPLKNLFDDVQIEILLDNCVSYRFSPVTGVLQCSILSPFLYSIYINRLPSILRQPLLLDNSFSGDIVSDLTPAINYLLYADDVVLIANPESLTALLHQCEAHSYSVGYRWNPLKCVIVAPNNDAQTYQLYGTTTPKESSFSYLGIHIKPGGLLDYPAMIQHNINKASLTINQLAAIGLSSKGFPPLLACRFYSQMIRAQLDYGLAISPLITKFIHQLDTFQNQCIRRIFGGHSRSSTQAMLHLVNLLSMRTHVAVLQVQHLFRTDQFQNLYNNSDSILLSSTRPTIQVDPILWLPMTCSERSRVLRWRLGWLPGGKPKECIFHPYHNWSRRHAFDCLNFHHRLYLPRSIEDPISFLLNLLPLHTPRPTESHSWFTLWPILFTILHELDYYFHDECPPPPVDPGVKLLNWLSK
ncbi:hypothetical protein G6F56_002274 [Rhizopus delemar]|nr:hypothetical protein G6F56_002274 [Rhizopus delemar]